MWKLNNIPKIAHFYWGNKEMNFLRYMTLFSFSKLNPDWQLVLYLPKVSSESDDSIPVVIKSKNYFDELESIKNLKIETIDLGEFNHFSEVHKSDFLRWRLLSTIGGLWSDMDIIYCKPMNDLEFNRDQHKNVDVVFVKYYDYPNIKPIGFLLSKASCKFYQEVVKQSEKILKSNNLANPFDDFKIDYQIIGTNIISQYNPAILKEQFDEEAIEADPECVYKFIWNKVGALFCDDRSVDILEDCNSIGIHWYGGSPVSAYIQENATKEKYTNFKCTITQLIDNVIKL
jgi:hypothetical protein